jgi:hypothetical protein
MSAPSLCNWMGNSSSSPPLSSRLSVDDESPLLTYDRLTFNRYFKESYLINILPITIIDIIIDYYKSLQQRIFSFGMNKQYSSIGWLSSELPARNGSLRISEWTTHNEGGVNANNDSKKIITDDIDGYRLVYGTCPLELSNILPLLMIYSMCMVDAQEMYMKVS